MLLSGRRGRHLLTS